MRPLSRAVPLLTVFAAVLTSGALHGVLTNRWASPEALRRAAARLADLPMTLGEWDGQPDELDPRQLAIADASGHVLRRYVNHRTGAAVSVLLLCGRPGPVSAHTPQVCYGASGFDLVGPQVRRGSPAGEVWASVFQKNSATGDGRRLRILHGWNAAGPWEAPDNPRFTFARAPALYKLMVVREMRPRDVPLEEGPAVEFLAALLPAAQKALFPAP
jgi:hypothetical protein